MKSFPYMPTFWCSAGAWALNIVATHLYEDLYDHGGCPKFNEHVVAGQCVVNVGGSTRGVKARRGDGTFGTIVPGSDPLKAEGFVVLQGMVALTHIGAELKIIATAHLKQIDRVLNDLRGSATSLKEKSANAITVRAPKALSKAAERPPTFGEDD